MKPAPPVTRMLRRFLMRPLNAKLTFAVGEPQPFPSDRAWAPNRKKRFQPGAAVGRNPKKTFNREATELRRSPLWPPWVLLCELRVKFFFARREENEPWSYGGR